MPLLFVHLQQIKTGTKAIWWRKKVPSAMEQADWTAKKNEKTFINRINRYDWKQTEQLKKQHCIKPTKLKKKHKDIYGHSNYLHPTREFLFSCLLHLYPLRRYMCCRQMVPHVPTVRLTERLLLSCTPPGHILLCRNSFAATLHAVSWRSRKLVLCTQLWHTLLPRVLRLALPPLLPDATPVEQEALYCLFLLTISVAWRPLRHRRFSSERPASPIQEIMGMYYGMREHTAYLPTGQGV